MSEIKYLIYRIAWNGKKIYAKKPCNSKKEAKHTIRLANAAGPGFKGTQFFIEPLKEK